MAQRLLSLLLVLPLLLPPGVCVCDFVHRCQACSECEAKVELAKPTCGCCRHRRAAPAGKDQRTIARTHTCHRSIPIDRRNDHAPGCPAKTGGSVWKIKTAQASLSVSPQFTGIFAMPDVPAASAALSSPSFHLAAADQPLYLTLLTLRI
jgi:hypothetical protein